jgi:hypothetical protein
VPIGQLAGGHPENHTGATWSEVSSNDRRIFARVEGERASIRASHQRARERPLGARDIRDSPVVVDQADGQLQRARRDHPLLGVVGRTL